MSNLTDRDLSRFWSKIRKTATCWLWTGVEPKFYCEGSFVFAYRLAYELEYGPVPTGLKVIRKCAEPMCVNPTHLFAGRKTDEFMASIERGRFNRQTLLPEDVLAILRLKELSGAVLAKRFGVTRSAISDIRRGRKWKWLSATVTP